MILDAILSVVAPYECLGCAQEGSLLCKTCVSLLEPPRSSCYRCKRPSINNMTCAACSPCTRLLSVVPCAVYQGVAKQLIWQLKLGGAQGAAKNMAGLMAPLLAGANDGSLLVPVPTASSRRRQRGYDQATLLARALARQTRLPCCYCLLRLGQTKQHGATRYQRLVQLQDSYHCPRPMLVQGRRVLLIDDVTTTGATLEAAANTLYQAGAAEISAIVFARP